MSFAWLWTLVEKISNLIDVIVTVEVVNGKIVKVDFDPIKEDKKYEKKYCK